jgi:hypothetical protein
VPSPAIPAPARPTPSVRLTLIGKPDCHLCDVAHDVVGRVADELGQDRVVVEQYSILDDPALYERYWEQIPVLLVNDVEHAHWRIDPDRLRAAILEV